MDMYIVFIDKYNRYISDPATGGERALFFPQTCTLCLFLLYGAALCVGRPGTNLDAPIV